MSTQPPPAHHEAERVVLGAILLDGRHVDACAGILDARHFATALHGRAFDALRTVSERGDEPNLSTLRAEMGRQEPLSGTDLAYLAGLLEGLPRVSDVVPWARQVREAARRRAVVTLGQRLAQAATDGAPLDETLDRHSNALLRLTEAGESRATIHVKTALSEALADLDRFATSAEGLTGIPTGLVELDRLTGGWQRGWLAIVAARPSRGKSVFCNQASLAAAMLGHSVLMFTLEMPPRAVARRMVLADSGVDRWQLRATADDIRARAWSSISGSVGRIGGLPIWMDTRERPNLAQIRATAKRFHSTTKGGLGLIVVDYLQRCAVDESEGKRYAALGELARGLKSLAMGLGVPVLCAAQLSRRAQDVRPSLADLRESGDIEQEADWVGLLHPAGKDPDEAMKADEPDVDLLGGKHRDGEVRDIPLVFTKRTGRFVERNMEWSGK